MSILRIYVGEFESSESGTRDERDIVSFEGDELADLRHEDPSKFYNPGGSYMDMTKTLYKAADGRLVVHSEIAGEIGGTVRSSSWIEQVTVEDLRPGGRLEDLGQQLRPKRTLTLDQALGDS